MAKSLELPMGDGDPRVEWRTRLGDTNAERFYTLILDWNTYAQAWAFSLLVGQGDQAGTALLRGVFVRVGENLLRHHTDVRLPPGALVPIDQSGERRDPGRDDMGSRVQLVYLTATEVADAA